MPTLKRKGQSVEFSKLEQIQLDDVVPFVLESGEIQDALLCGIEPGFSPRGYHLFLARMSDKPGGTAFPRQFAYEGGMLCVGENGLRSKKGNYENGFPLATQVNSCNRWGFYPADSALRQAGL